MNFDDAFNPAAAVHTSECDDGSSLSVEFACGDVRGWLDVQDGVFGRKIRVWRYGTKGEPNEEITDWTGR